MVTKFKNGLRTYTCIEEAVAAQIDFIYIKKNNLSVEVFPFTNVFSAICDVGDVSIYEAGFPSELITLIDMNIEVPQIKYIDDGSIAYYCPNGADTKEQVMSIIKLCNQLLNLNLTIYTTDEIHKYVSCFANQNITFCCYNRPNDVFIECSKIITYGYSARYFIQQKIPTIIIGHYGFGGWVTPDNISFLIKENFRGRPGGTINELVPHEIIFDEILEIQESSNLEKILTENKVLIDNYLDSFKLRGLQTIITDNNELFGRWISSSQRWDLRPRLVSNISIIKSKTTICVQRRMINDVLFSLPISDFDFIKDLQNNLTCKELQIKHEVTPEEFWEIMTPLWELKAIYFSL